MRAWCLLGALIQALAARCGRGGVMNCEGIIHIVLLATQIISLWAVIIYYFRKTIRWWSGDVLFAYTDDDWWERQNMHDWSKEAKKRLEKYFKTQERIRTSRLRFLGKLCRRGDPNTCILIGNKKLGTAQVIYIGKCRDMPL